MAPVHASKPTVPSPAPADQPAATDGAMSIDEFCRRYCVGKTKAYAEAKAGRLQMLKIGSKTVVARAEAQRWLNSLPTASAA
ncbi:hypothetical protein [Bradyrhizobium cenepequi]